MNVSFTQIATTICTLTESCTHLPNYDISTASPTVLAVQLHLRLDNYNDIFGQHNSPHPRETSQPWKYSSSASNMTSIDNLLKLSTELSKLGAELTEVGGKLAHAAATLQQEAANIAEELSKQWGVDVSVNVGVRPGGRYDTTVVKK